LDAAENQTGGRIARKQCAAALAAGQRAIAACQIQATFAIERMALRQ
jgi:hypothetical protein